MVMVEFVASRIFNKGVIRAGHRNRIRVRPYNVRLAYGYLPYRLHAVYRPSAKLDGTVTVSLTAVRRVLRCYGINNKF
jgi:hypothetical protein